ncbi:hypothetical protein FN846DRAFT_796095 [Sphaerosporella brunnea]|uniref:ER membrane protein complex subunit 1 n=1 Tax=Sphaerosporella brunnea TaxID=1250544 RepID=A0A5J5EXF8_9PEZI|nr:hypothetical protein FN846DRAFT_796095 [Sphaerosporella brunnea]
MRLLSRLWLPCLILNVVSVLAIFKDDAYHTDWHIPLIGPSIAASTFFHRPNAESRASLIYTLTTRSILAAINPKDGELVWRQPLAESNGTGIACGGNGIIVSATGSAVASFDAANGRLFWENQFSSKIVDLGVTATNAVVVLFEDGAVRLLKEQTGDVAWEWNFVDSTDVPISLHVAESTVTVALSHISKLHLTTLSLATGREVGSPLSVAGHPDIPSTHRALHGDDVLSWTERSGSILKFMPLAPTPAPAFVDIPQDVIETTVVALKDRIAVHYKTGANSWVDIFTVDAGTAVKHYSLQPKAGAHSAISLSTSGDVTYLVWTSTDETLLYDTNRPEILETYPHPQGQSVNATLAISEVVARLDGSWAMRSFVSSWALGFVGDTHLIRNGEIAWTRPESLSSIVASTWVELLDPTTEGIVEDLNVETHTSIGAAYIHRVKRHLNELAEYGPDWVKALPQRIYNAFLSVENTESERTGKWKDFFGFRKFAVVVTAEGGLAAIDVGKNGEVVWKASLVSPPVKFAGISGIYEVRKGTVAIVAADGEYIEYDAFEGNELLRAELGAPALTSALVDTPSETKAVVVILDNGKSVVLPPSPDLGPVYLSIKESSRLVKGLRVTGLSHHPETTWTFVPPASEEITSVVSRPVHDPVASIGRVLGDRSVIYKYLNQHLLVITTINPTLSTASVYILDAVSGAVLHSATHSGVDTSQPIRVGVSENWVVYSYFGDDDVVSTPGGAAKGYHLVVSELYESEFANDRGSLGQAANVSSLTGAGKPYVLSQSYIFPSPIEAFAVSSTKQGITAREILILLPGTAGIYTLPKRIIDPRRPVGREPDNAEKEEGLFRYQPVIEIDPRSIITHERKVLGLKKMETTPAELESTSIVFAYGLDLFGARLAPSMTFDMLGKGFGKIQLVGTVVALAIGAAVVAPMVRRKQINSRWSAM